MPTPVSLSARRLPRQEGQAYAELELDLDDLINAERDTGYAARPAREGTRRDPGAEHRAGLRDLAGAAMTTSSVSLVSNSLLPIRGKSRRTD